MVDVVQKDIFLRNAVGAKIIFAQNVGNWDIFEVFATLKQRYLVPHASRALTEEQTQDIKVRSATAYLDDVDVDADADEVYSFRINKELMNRNTHPILINGSPIDIFIG